MATPRMRSPLSRAIGLGSAKEGVDHWWAQRVTALALVPLALWFVIAIIELAGAAASGRSSVTLKPPLPAPPSGRSLPPSPRAALACPPSTASSGQCAGARLR